MHFVSACLVMLKTNEVFLAVTIPGINHNALSWVKTHVQYQLMISIIDVTRHDKTMLIYLKYTSLYCFNYLTFCVSYISSINCVRFLIVSCTINKSVTDTLCLDKKLQNLKK